MDINSGTIAALTTGFRRNFASGLAATTALWSQLATEIPSTTAQNTYPWLGDMPGMREWVGDRQIKDFSAGDYTIKNRKFEQTVGVLRDKIEDDEYGLYAPLFTGLGEAAGMWPDELVFDAVRGAFANKCYDGQYFFDTDHPVYDKDGEVSGTVSNFQAGAGSPWMLLNTKRSLKPFIFQMRKKPSKLVKLDRDEDHNVFMRDQYLYGTDGRGNAGYGFWQMAYASKDTLNEANFKTVRLGMRSIKDGRGRALVNEPNLLVVGTANADAAEELIKKLRKQNGEDNVLAGSVDILVAPHLY